MDNLESNNSENETCDFDVTDRERKIETNKIPKPIPAGSADISPAPSGAPLTEDTIAIKKPIIPSQSQTPLSFDNIEEPVMETEEEKEPERRLKIFCYNCSQKLDLTDMEPFSKVECPSCSGEILVPRWWDNYLLEEKCGIGGMAEVFRGLDLALDREVAIKILNSEIANENERNKLFLHEARTSATLNHYAILPIYTCGEFEGQAYFVMQYMGGGSLEMSLEDFVATPLKIEEAVKWLKDICEGLDNARRHGIIHHDIKPGNFMLDQDRNIKIGDFGISQALNDSRSEELNELTKHWGSPDYVSPEKVSTGKESYLGDIYSLGASFYHLLTGETPFDNSDTEELLKAKTIKDPIDIRKLREDIPEPLAILLSKMMDRTPEARPSYRDIIAELNSFSKTGAKNKKPNVKKQVKTSQAATATAMNIKTKAKIKNMDMSKYGIKKKNPVSTIIIILLILAILGGIIYCFVDPGIRSKITKYLPEGLANYLDDSSTDQSIDNQDGVIQSTNGYDPDMRSEDDPVVPDVPPEGAPDDSDMTPVEDPDSSGNDANNTDGNDSYIPESSMKVADASKEWFENNRSFADKRPKPDNFYFTAAVNLQDYLSSLPVEIRNKEIKRFAIIKDLKKNLYLKMMRKPYKGELKVGKEIIKGTILCNNEEIILTNPGEKPKRFDWDKFHVDQFLKLLNNYASDANDYLDIALMCDWYGRYKHAATFAKRAVEKDPDIEPKVISLLLE